MKKKKEKEWESNSMNRWEDGYYTTFVVGFCCVSGASALVSYSFCVRGTVLGRRPSLSVSLASERLAKGNYQLTDQQAGSGRLVIG